MWIPQEQAWVRLRSIIPHPHPHPSLSPFCFFLRGFSTVRPYRVSSQHVDESAYMTQRSYRHTAARRRTHARAHQRPLAYLRHLAGDSNDESGIDSAGCAEVGGTWTPYTCQNMHDYWFKFPDGESRGRQARGAVVKDEYVLRCD